MEFKKCAYMDIFLKLGHMYSTAVLYNTNEILRAFNECSIRSPNYVHFIRVAN